MFPPQEHIHPLRWMWMNKIIPDALASICPSTKLQKLFYSYFLLSRILLAGSLTRHPRCFIGWKCFGTSWKNLHLCRSFFYVVLLLIQILSVLCIWSSYWCLLCSFWPSFLPKVSFIKFFTWYSKLPRRDLEFSHVNIGVMGPITPRCSFPEFRFKLQ